MEKTTKDLTAHDYYTLYKEFFLQSSPLTATGISLRNFATYVGVEYGPEDSDAEVRRLYFEAMNALGVIYDTV